MNNKIGRKDSKNNAEEEEEVTSEKIKGKNVKQEKRVEGEGKKDTMAGNTDSSITETALTQNGAVEGNTNQSSAEVSEKADKPPEPLKPQQSDNIPVSPESEADIDLTQIIPASTSNSYKSNTMFFKPENHIASDSYSHTLYSDTNLDPKNLAEISEDGMLALRLTETERTSPLMSPSPTEPLSPSANAPNIIAPKQIVRIERDYTRGELCQFQTAFPMEIDGRNVKVKIGREVIHWFAQEPMRGLLREDLVPREAQALSEGRTIEFMVEAMWPK
ncbi:1793_t:CDS:2 [Acaulospora colombiana]|uniref:1793_t:CDS:1 n=1 Tax=Acaulospora colombiana TaxID=27376 RepID=A0ACA9L2L4_9GLOM|nr:1793_t:CDS:2 [Acaulospora colombiana]